MHAGQLNCLACQFTVGRLRQRLFEQAVNRQIETFRSYRSSQIMLLQYDDIWHQVEEIAAFFGIEDERFVQTFPARRQRASRQYAKEVAQ